MYDGLKKLITYKEYCLDKGITFEDVLEFINWTLKNIESDKIDKKTNLKKQYGFYNLFIFPINNLKYLTGCYLFKKEYEEHIWEKSIKKVGKEHILKVNLSSPKME